MKENAQKDFSPLTKILLVAATLFIVASIYISFKALGDTTLGLTLFSNPDLEDGLVNHWTFDANNISGVTITDRGSGGVNGTASTTEQGGSGATSTSAYTSDDTFVVPSGVNFVQAKVWGAGGGGGGTGGQAAATGGGGGGGGFSGGDITTTPGESLTIDVGGGGAGGVDAGTCSQGGGGGGYSAVLRSSTILIQAGGGGGGGGAANGSLEDGGGGGGGGGANGSDGHDGNNAASTEGDGGSAGTTSVGGAGGSGGTESDGAAGSANQGGAGGDPSGTTGGGASGGANGGGDSGDSETSCTGSDPGGGGGGGGQFGGGGGEAGDSEGAGGGGGGSGDTTGLTGVTTETGTQGATTGGTAGSAANTGDSDYSGSAGNGGAGGQGSDGTNGTAGNGGRIVIKYQDSTTPTLPYASLGKLGQGFFFDGENDFVDIGNAGSGIKTIAFWMKTATTSYNMKVIDIDGTDQIELNGGSNIAATSFPGTTTIYVDGSSASAAIATSTWQHVVITDTTGVNASDMDIGRVEGAGFYGGSIDDVRLYNKVLSANQVGRLYELGATTVVGKTINTNTAIQGGLTLHYTFDPKDISGDTITDASGNGNNGTAGGGGGASTHDLANASYDSKSKDVSAQDGAPSDIHFNDDGTIMYMLGDTSPETVYQYTLSTAWDVSTASYASKSASVDSEIANSRGLDFSDDGTKMYVIDNGDDDVHQYTLSTAWDVSTASYASKTLDASSEDTIANGISFSDDGTKLYIDGNANNTIYQYTLSTAWDLSTASYASKSKSVTTEASNPIGGVEFNSDGTRMLVHDFLTDSIYQYTLSTGWDVSTASYDSVSFSTGNETTSPFGMGEKADGTKLYVVDRTTDTVYQYTSTDGGGSATINPVLGRLGQGLYFDGTDDFIDVGNVGSGVKSIAFWMKTAITSYNMKIIDIDGTDQIELNGSSEIAATSFPGTTTIYVDGSSASAAIATSTWQHVVITDTTGVNASDMDLGRVEGAGFYGGTLDDVRIYTKVLSAAEAKRLYQIGATTVVGKTLATNPDLEDSLNGHWTFDGSSVTSTSVTDRSSSGVNGTLAADGGSGTTTETYTTAGDDTFVVPAGITTIQIKAWGAGGGGGDTGSKSGGAGAGAGFAQADISVTPSESLTVTVGEKGTAGNGGTGGSGGSPGGGDGVAGTASFFAGGGGGGQSRVRRSSTDLLVAAGGGGGGGYCTLADGDSSGSAGGAGGGTTGTNGGGVISARGGGGTQSAGGSGGGTGDDGSFGAGGNGGNSGGGGGGGYYGGGGAGVDVFFEFDLGPPEVTVVRCDSSGGGGGGSSYTTGTATTNTSGSGTTPGNTGDSDYSGSVGVGGSADTNGNDGKVVIKYSVATEADYRVGRVGQSIYFDRDGTYVDIGNAGSGIKTIAFWMRTATTTTSMKIIDIDGTDQIELNGSSQVTATSFPGTTTVYVDGAVASAVNNGEWHHVVITDTTGVNASDMDLGRVEGGGVYGGYLDDVRIYTKVLTAEEVGRLYELGN